MAENDKDGNPELPEDPEDLFNPSKGPKEDEVRNKGKGDGVPNSDGGGESGSDGGGDLPDDEGDKPIEWASPEDELNALRMVTGTLYDQNRELAASNAILLSYLSRSNAILKSLGVQQSKIDQDIVKCFTDINADLAQFAKNQSDLQNEGIKLAEAHASLIEKYLVLAGEYLKMSVCVTTMAGAIDSFKIGAVIIAASALVAGFAGGLFIHKLPVLIDLVSFWLR